MKSFRQHITEKPAKLSSAFPYKGAEWSDFRGFENPSEKEITTALNKSKIKELRFVVDSKGKMWMWDSYDAIHEPVIYAMTGEKYVGDYAKGFVQFFDIGASLTRRPAQSGNLKVTIMNTRTVGTNFALKNKTLKLLAKRINAKGKDRVYWSDI